MQFLLDEYTNLSQDIISNSELISYKLDINTLAKENLRKIETFLSKSSDIINYENRTSHVKQKVEIWKKEFEKVNNIFYEKDNFEGKVLWKEPSSPVFSSNKNLKKCFEYFSKILEDHLYEARKKEAKNILSLIFTEDWISDKREKLLELENIICKKKVTYFDVVILLRLYYYINRAYWELISEKNKTVEKIYSLHKVCCNDFENSVQKILGYTYNSSLKTVLECGSERSFDIFVQSLKQKNPDHIFNQKKVGFISNKDILLLQEEIVEKRIIVYSLYLMKENFLNENIFLSNCVYYEDIFSDTKSTLSVEREKIISFDDKEKLFSNINNYHKLIIPIIIDKKVSCCILIISDISSCIIKFYNPYSDQLYYVNSSLFFLVKSILIEIFQRRGNSLRPEYSENFQKIKMEEHIFSHQKTPFLNFMNIICIIKYIMEKRNPETITNNDLQNMKLILFELLQTQQSNN